MLHDLETKRTHKDKNGYLMAYYPSHPNAWKNGAVYWHRLVMENHLGRLLSRAEQVHHENENIEDNRIENLEILSLAQHQNRHFSKLKEIKCRGCGKVFKPHQSRNSACSAICGQIARRKVERPSREVLEAELEKSNFVQVGKKYKVTDNTIRHWLKPDKKEQP